MQQGRTARSVGAVMAGTGVALVLLSGCSEADEADEAAAATTSLAAALSSAAQASPGDYGSPVDPELPNPTAVATDPPAATLGTDVLTVVITYAGWIDDTSAVEVGAVIPGLVEDGGTCTLTLTGNDGPITTTSTGAADAGSTSCPLLSIPGSDLPSGSYSAVVSYRSPAATGSSTPTALDVP